MNYIIFDLEASCRQTKNPLVRQEIIEIGAYRLNSFYEIEGEFDSLVQPSVIRGISNYCTNLTGITQEHLNKAERFPKVFKEFKDWIYEQEEDFVLLSWGRTDLELIRQECQFHMIEVSWFNYKDLKK